SPGAGARDPRHAVGATVNSPQLMGRRGILTSSLLVLAPFVVLFLPQGHVITQHHQALVGVPRPAVLQWMQRSAWYDLEMDARMIGYQTWCGTGETGQWHGHIPADGGGGWGHRQTSSNWFLVSTSGCRGTHLKRDRRLVAPCRGASSRSL